MEDFSRKILGQKEFLKKFFAVTQIEGLSS